MCVAMAQALSRVHGMPNLLECIVWVHPFPALSIVGASQQAQDFHMCLRACVVCKWRTCDTTHRSMLYLTHPLQAHLSSRDEHRELSSSWREHVVQVLMTPPLRSMNDVIAMLCEQPAASSYHGAELLWTRALMVH